MRQLMDNPFYLCAFFLLIVAAVFGLCAGIYFFLSKKKKRKKAPTVSESDTEMTEPEKREMVSESDTDQKNEEFKNNVINHFRNSETLKQTLIEMEEEYPEGSYRSRIENALDYLCYSKYRDFETTLEYLFAGMEAAQLKKDLLQMEILRYRRIGTSSKNQTEGRT